VVADYLRSLRNIQGIRLTTGRYDIFTYGVFRNSQELIGFIEGELSHVPELTGIEQIMILEIVKHSWMYLRGDTDAYAEAIPCDLDEWDLRLIQELEMHPRASITDLEKGLGMSRKPITKKLQTLMNNNIIRVCSVIDPLAFGFGVEAGILVRVEPGKIRSTASTLTIDKRVNHVAIITGSFALFFIAIFHDLAELSDFLRNDLGNIPGVISHETIVYVARMKESFALISSQDASK